MYNIESDDIIEIAQKAGEIAMRFYDKEYSIEEKKNKTPVTEADMAIHHFLMEKLSAYNYPILSEEDVENFDRGDAEHMWIVDPLDGTSDFIQKTGDFSILIGLIYNDEPVLGVVYEPAKDTIYFAEKNKGAYMCHSRENGNPEKISVSDKNNFSDMTILLSRNHLMDSDIALCENLSIEKQKKRGSTSKMCVIARGDAEIYVNTSDRTAEWDTCAVQIILEEAGGKITDMNGERLVYGKENPLNLNGFIASNGISHNEIVSAIKK